MKGLPWRDYSGNYFISSIDLNNEEILLDKIMEAMNSENFPENVDESLKNLFDKPRESISSDTPGDYECMVFKKKDGIIDYDEIECFRTDSLIELEKFHYAMIKKYLLGEETWKQKLKKWMSYTKKF